MHSPPFAWASVPLFAAGFDEALELLFPGRRITVVGISMGGTTALHMRSPLVRSMVLADPPLRTGQLWPLVGYWQIAARCLGRRGLALEHSRHWPHDAIEDRDYRGRTRQPLGYPAFPAWAASPCFLSVRCATCLA
jgi:pimeloyl-ACP methyl ester carboxylesterase